NPDLSNITKFLAEGQQRAIEWLTVNHLEPSHQVMAWREVWHPDKVEVWGRIAEDQHSSEAIKWFHGPYSKNQSINQSDLTGKLNNIGRIWHRMYPRYLTTKNGELRQKRQEHVELLTIFPDKSDKTQDFLEFLQNQSDFIKLWPIEE
ncbi:hypothetical protein Q5687_20075, partial [Microcoleus sp. AT10_D2]